VVGKEMGIPTVCDHSIAHPGVMQYMVENQGRWPTIAETREAGPLQGLMRRDIHQAGHLIVNSDFVKSTCVFAGLDEEKIHVVYAGVESRLLATVPKFSFDHVRARLGAGLLFAGAIQQRKGIRTLAQAYLALERPPPVQLIGDVEANLDKQPEVKAFLSHTLVRVSGFVPRSELTSYMLRSPVFVFPSYCEGSARVIFAAMASGCFIITTPNSGSIVRHMENGLVVPAGDAKALADAIKWALENPDAVAEIGWENSMLIRKEFTQAHYAQKVVEVYRRILGLSRAD
jgi:glycosyltransferase involved in cell wall biosynthesis